jgi:hypothetical protein
MSERATTKVFGLGLTVVFVGILILNAITYW